MRFLGVNFISDTIASFSDFFGGSSATYEDIMPKGEISHYDIMRYFVAIGRAEAAGKFYVD